MKGVIANKEGALLLKEALVAQKKRKKEQQN